MAEISESSRPAEVASEISPMGTLQSDFDPKTMRKTKPGLKRLILTIFVLFSFILGFPFLWKSVEIYRAPLPFRDIDALSAEIESKPLQFPCHVQAIFIGFDSSPSISSKAEELQLSILNAMGNLIPKIPFCSTCSNYSVSVTMDSTSYCARSDNSNPSCLWKCGSLSAVDFGGKDEHITDEMLEFRLRDCSSSESDQRVYNLVVVNRDEETKAVVGKYRHAWIVGKVSEEEAVSRAAEIFVKLFVNGGREEGMIPGEFMPVGSDGKIVLSFTLLNADPVDWIYNWNFQAVDEILLTPIIEALAPIADISVESQVLYYTPKSSFSMWEDSLDANIFTIEDLPFFVNANEWHLDTSIAAGGRSKILQFVVFVPSANECPLLLELPDAKISSTNGFISPMWGGVIVWNPQCSPRNSDQELLPRHMISPKDLQKIVEVFTGQLRQLFGLKSLSVYVGVSGTYTLLTSVRGFTEWELDFLSRQHSCFNLHSCSTTLASLSRLVQSLPRMIIMDEIGKQVKYSLEAANLAQSNASLGVYDAAAISSRQSRSLAEDAFFHPSIMSVSYYSFEHCFAVYSPFFLPVSLHVILAAVREWRRYRKESQKYAAWKVKESSS